MDGSWTLESTFDVVIPAREEPETTTKIETWTAERIADLTRLWEEGVTTAEIGRRRLPRCGRGDEPQCVNFRIARSMPARVSGNMRSSISARIMPMLVVPPQYFSGTGLSHTAFGYASSSRRIHSAPASSFQR